MFDRLRKSIADVRATMGRLVRGILAVLLVLALAGSPGEAAAQDTPPPSPAPTTWSFGASAYAYFVPEDDDYLQPTFTADRGGLHLEARYNYEDLHTGSTWIGWNFSAGQSVVFEITPIAGVVFGDTRGIAPGYKASLGWRALELYSEGEHMFDLDDDADSYFYNWSQVTVAPTEWGTIGVVTQRTRAYESERELQRGVLLGFTHGGGTLSAIVFNPDDPDPLVAVAASLEF